MIDEMVNEIDRDRRVKRDQQVESIPLENNRLLIPETSQIKSPHRVIFRSDSFTGSDRAATAEPQDK